MALPLALLGLAALVVFTLAAVWYVNRRLKTLEAKVKLSGGLSGSNIKQMERLQGDVSEVKHNIHQLAGEMGLRLAAAQPPAKRDELPRVCAAAEVKASPPHVEVKASAPPPVAAPAAPPPTAAAPPPAVAQAVAPPPVEVKASAPLVVAQAAPPAEDPTPPPAAAEKPKGKGKGKRRAIAFDLFPEFVGPPVPRVEEVHSECEGDVCPVPK
jgi:hypothetical protein